MRRKRLIDPTMSHTDQLARRAEAHRQAQGAMWRQTLLALLVLALFAAGALLLAGGMR